MFEGMSAASVDAVVIGAGAGGGIVAAELALFFYRWLVRWWRNDPLSGPFVEISSADIPPQIALRPDYRLYG